LARAAAGIASAALLGAAVSGCQFTGFGNESLPFTHGTGSGTYTVMAQVANVDNLAPNSEVMVNDVSVGTVKAIHFSNWHADLTISLPDSVKLPANATATIGQKSLLGAEYVALAPPTNARPAGTLANGGRIGLASSTAYPATEDVLASLSTFLNGGGLNQLSTITREMNATLNGHEQQARQLLSNLQVFSGTVNQQKQSIVSTLSSMNTLAAQVRSQNKTLTNAIDGIPGGLKVLNKDEGDLTQALSSLSNLSTVADRVINENSANLLGNLHDLQAPLQQLVSSEKNLVNGLTAVATFPLPTKVVLNTTKGDYTNVNIVFDLTSSTLQKTWLSSGATGSSSGKNSNPLTAPVKGVQGIVNGVTGGTKNSPNSTPSSGSTPSSSPSPKPTCSSNLGGAINGALGGCSK